MDAEVLRLFVNPYLNSMETLSDALKWRYATKKMTGQAVPADQLSSVLEAVRMAASSLGLQPYRVVVVDSPTLKQEIYNRACPQDQVLECSHLLVFASWVQLSAAQVGEYIGRMAALRDVPVSALQGFADMINGGIASRTPAQNADWAARQAYIGLGFGLCAAALQRVDACPMEGFDPVQMDAVLGLSGKNLHSVALMALGYRDAVRDKLADAVKVRVPREDFFLYNKG